MKSHQRQSSYVADKALLNAFSIWCVNNNTTRTVMIVKFITQCVAADNKK